MTERLELRYGLNPHQVPATVSMPTGTRLPFRVLNGRAGYANLLDALKAWQIAREVSAAVGLPSATSLKHTNPVGAGVAVPLSTSERSALHVEELELTPLTIAYARARGADPVAAYGDFIGLSEPMDRATARLVQRVVSDGVVALRYEPGVLEILRQKKRGAYLVIEMDATYEPPLMEESELFGVRFEQRRNDATIDARLLDRVVTRETAIPAEARHDLLLATVVVKYSQSNAVCVAAGGQAIGVGVGQQSRIDCTRIACEKADRWVLRSHERVRALRFRPGVKQFERDNLIDRFVRAGEVIPNERETVRREFAESPEPLSSDERRACLARFRFASLSSDGFIPFRDNIDRAAESGIRYIVQPGGSLRDDDVIAAANAREMVMAFSGLRLFYH